MKTIVLTVEIKVDENKINKKYPNFGINYDLNADLTPSDKGLIAFAKSNVMTENAMGDFGYSSKITKTLLKNSGAK